MQKVQLENSDLHISPIAFGAFPIGGWRWGKTDDKEALNALRAGLEHGVTSIDTAPVYGLGHSERLVGDLVKEVGRDKIEILTKFGWNWKMNKGEHVMDGAEPGGETKKIHSYHGKDGITMEVEDSLRRLNTDYIDLYQLHRPDGITSIGETMEVLLELKKAGKIRAIGVSNCTVAQMEEAESVVEIASTQSPYSMVYRKIEKNIVPHSLEKGIGILGYSALQRGLLTGKIKSGHQFGEEDARSGNRFFQEPNLARTNEFLDKIKPIADGHGVTLGQLAINWTVQRPGITCALVGARNSEQMKQNAGSLAFKLSSAEIDKVNRELGNLMIE